MKKTFGIGVVFVMLAGAVGVVAKEEKDFSRPIKGGNQKIEKKVALTKEQRSLMEENLKGKPGELPTKGKPAPSDQTKPGATGILGTQLAPGADRYAVVIGLSNYIGTENDLCVEPTTEDYPAGLCQDGDALSMKKTLIDKYGYMESDIRIFSDADARFNDIYLAVQNIVANATADDEITFFFSGHSATSSTDPDGDGESLDEGLALYNGDVIWDGVLKAWFASAPTSRIMFAFDTCKAGGMNDLEKDGRVLAMSSSETRYSYTYYLGGEDGHVGEGMFTHYFVNEGMYAGLADGYNPLKSRDTRKYDGLVAVEEAFNFALKFVPLATGNYQVPILSDKFLNDLLL